MAEISVRCFSCGTTLKFQDRIGRQEECPQCRNDVRCCRNCRFYDPKVYNECKENQADPIREKDRANLCDFFQANSGANAAEERSNLLKAAEALFKKTPS